MNIKKRNLFDELMEGVDSLKAEREGKTSLKRVSLPSGVAHNAESERAETKPDSIKAEKRIYD